MAEIVWTAEAERWLKDIYEYIARDNPNASVRTVQGIVEKAGLLSRFPELGYRHPCQTKQEQDIRITLYGHYRIAYCVQPDGNVAVLGVFHAALDIDRLLT